ncbi:hypothetical protein [Chitinophaga nivalis]|uniref:Lipoprotein n=1 Tax=Chitinophaga nivalis TaxID=2991709 RepID=A0ABT3ITA1_9BACT|nr:hypothetical protein [Chitinophaga nivalis]MCW3463194.1 hypothetical protein [Chitinophaga nivalis]MCW3487116.1 hypothetical protein [Chitinophaga nivalis]
MFAFKSAIAVALSLSLLSIACKKDAALQDNVENTRSGTRGFKSSQYQGVDYLSVQLAGGFTTAGAQPPTYLITATESFEIKNVYIAPVYVKLSADAHESLKGYFSGFPKSHIKGDANVGKYSCRSCADNAYWVLNYHEHNGTDDTMIEVDLGHGPDYIKHYLEQLKTALSHL